ncbi:serine/threonine-protein kinase [Stigmatella sp. ncwal1]|uniref:Serine/threonine-protein kinase n=1 Tax=Stigmatella ashevillensis TaxID=2995309 RepID=A0ABT5D2A2_9BACT|nr:serine/threonine-protein kinase [Stigmatella ashevillena]MDC0707263.1 serine/threonine-protein kinase [Stigmatella ashevillena]
MASPCAHCGSTAGPDHLCSGASLALLGQVLDGRYKIESVLGHGGMGMVFRATQTSVQRPVAVKTLNSALAVAPTFFERFRREAEVASRLRHPNVITIFDFGRTSDGTCYYVMELLGGESLKEIVKRDGPMPLRRAVNLLEQSARGLAHAHAENCVHRDLKPHNIMVQQLDGKDFVKVLDFGLVKAMEQDEEEQLTSTGQVLGTPQYMPPEQAGGELVDARSDLYALTGVFFYCLTGTSPYGANTVRKALTAALTQTVPAVNSKRQGAPVPPSIDAFMQKGLAREKEDRFQSAEEFIEEMLEAVEDLSPEEMDALPSGGATGRDSSSSSKPSISKPRRAGSPVGSSSVRSSRPSSGASSRSPNVIVAKGSSGTPSSNRSKSAGGTSQRPASARSEDRSTAPEEGMSVAKKAALVGIPVLLLAAGLGVVAVKMRGEDPSAAKPPRERAPLEQVQAPPPSSPPPSPPESPTAALSPTVLVKCNTTPDGAAIFNEKDEQIGTTPGTLALPRGQKHRLIFRLAGHQDVERPLDLSIAAGDMLAVDVPLTPSRTASPPPSKPRPSRPAAPASSDISIFE